MNRAQRRAELRGTPRNLRGVPVISITREHMAAHFPPSTRDGDVVTLRGFSTRVQADGKRAIIKCEPGNETPFKLELRI